MTVDERPNEEERRLVTSSLMPDADAKLGQMGDTGRHWSRCKLKIGSNVHPKQICRVCLEIDERDLQMGTASGRACSPKTVITEAPVTKVR